MNLAQNAWYDSMEGYFRHAYGHEDAQYGVCTTLSAEQLMANVLAVSMATGTPILPPDLDGNLLTAEPTWQGVRVTALPIVLPTGSDERPFEDDDDAKIMSWIRHGCIRTSATPVDFIKINGLFTKIFNAEQRKSYKTLEHEIIQGSMALAALNQVATELATGMERAIQDAVDAIAKEYEGKGMKFHTLIGGEAYKNGNAYQESNAGKMAANCMFFPGEDRFFKNPADGGTDIRHTYKDGTDGENYEAGNWSNGNYWWNKQGDTVNGGFRRQLGNFRPTSGDWTSYAYTWHCAGKHFQVNKEVYKEYQKNPLTNAFLLDTISPPSQVSIRYGNSVVPGYYPNFIDQAKDNSPYIQMPTFDVYYQQTTMGMTPDMAWYVAANNGEGGVNNFINDMCLKLNAYYNTYPILGQNGIAGFSQERYNQYLMLYQMALAWGGNTQAIQAGILTELNQKRAEFNSFANNTIPQMNHNIRQAWEANHIKEYTNEDMTPWDNWIIPAGNLPDLCNYNHSATARPRIVNHRLFSKLGSIVVGACYAVGNPTATSRILGKAFTPRNSSSLCAVAAARAGVRWPGEGEVEGAYRSCWSTQREAKWNLYVDDWDAIMLPIAKAWLICHDDDNNALNTIWRQPIPSNDYYTEYSTASLINAVMTGLGINKNLTELDSDVMH
jgi:hypothetical protein